MGSNNRTNRLGLMLIACLITLSCLGLLGLSTLALADVEATQEVTTQPENSQASSDALELQAQEDAAQKEAGQPEAGEILTAEEAEPNAIDPEASEQRSSEEPVEQSSEEPDEQSTGTESARAEGETIGTEAEEAESPEGLSADNEGQGTIYIEVVDEEVPDGWTLLDCVFFIYDENGNEVTRSFYTRNASYSYDSGYRRSGDQMTLELNAEGAYIQNVPAGYTYRVVYRRDNSHWDSYQPYRWYLTRTENAEGVVEADKTTKVKMVVHRDMYLYIGSNVERNSGSIPEDEFTYRITVTDADGNPLTNEKNYTYSGTGHETRTGVSSDSTFTVKLGGDHYFYLFNLPKGTKYTVEEIDVPSRWTPDGELVRNGVIDNKDYNVFERFNHKSDEHFRDFTVSKQVTVGSDVTTQFEMELTFLRGDEELANTFSYSGSAIEGVEPPESGTVSSGSIIKLAHGQSIVIKDVPYGVSVKVNETLPEGWQRLVNNRRPTTDTEIITSGESASYLNDQYSVPRGGLSFEKVLENAPSTYYTATYKLYLFDQNGNPVTGALTYKDKYTTGSISPSWNEKHYKVSFRMGDPYSILDIPAGYTYLVEEEMPQSFGSSGFLDLTDSTNASGTIAADEITNVSLTNTYFEGEMPPQTEYSYIYHDYSVEEWYYPDSGTISFLVRVYDDEGSESSDEFTYEVAGKQYAFSSGDTITPVRESGNVSRTSFKLPVGYRITIAYQGTTDPCLSLSSGSYHSVVAPSKGNYRTVYTRFICNTLTVYKDDDGGPQNGVFSFTVTLKDADGAPITGPVKLLLNSSSGAATLSTAEFDENGCYSFSMDSQSRMIFVDLPEGAQYKVVENEVPSEFELFEENSEGTISAQAGRTQLARMRNVWRATVPVHLEFTKEYNGHLKEGQFSFQVADNLGKVLATATNDAQGNVVFDFELDHTYLRQYQRLKVTEIAGDDPHVVYDNSTKVVKTRVMWVENSLGELTAPVTYEDDDTVFTNSVRLFPVSIIKTNESGEALEGASFELHDAAGDVIGTWTSTTEAIAFQLEVGSYTIVETNAPAEYDIADEVAFTVDSDGTIGGVELVDGAIVVVDKLLPAEFTVEKSVDVGAGISVEPGNTLTYTLNYENTGKGAGDLIIKDTVPQNTTLVEGSESGGGSFADGVITWNLAGIEPGEKGQVSFQVVVDEDTWGKTISNVATYSFEDQELSSNAVSNPVVPEPVALTQLDVLKRWNDGDDKDGLRPKEVHVVLLANGTPTNTIITLNEGNGWQGSFTDLPMTDEEGNVIEYWATETEVPEGYAATESMDTSESVPLLDILNTHTPVPDPAPKPPAPKPARKPLPKPQPKIPKTADLTNPAVLYALSLIGSSAVGLGIAMKKRRF